MRVARVAQRQGSSPEWAETPVACDDPQAKRVNAAPGRTRRTEGDAQESALLILQAGTACSEHERQWNIARDFLGTFRRELSVLVPKFPVLFPLPVNLCGAKCPDLFEKAGAGGGNRTRDIQLGKLSFYH
jgi:hypothetical protein